MSDSQFSVGIKHGYSKELRTTKGRYPRGTTEGRRAVSLLHNKINAEHDDVLKRRFSTKKPCEKLWSKLPKEIQEITEVQESFPMTELNEFFR